MAGAEFNLLGEHAIERGFPWSLRFTRKNPDRKTPVDLTGYAARLEIFDTQRARGAPRVYSTASGHVVLNAPKGEFVCKLVAAETAALGVTAARYRVIFTDSQGEETVLLRGRLAVLEGFK